MTLTNKEKELIVSCLLHTASPDVCIDLTNVESKQLVEIANKLNDVKIKHAYVYGDKEFYDELDLTEKILKDFDIRQVKDK